MDDSIKRFAEITASLDQWSTISELVELCDSGGFWGDEFVPRPAKAAAIHRLVKTLPGEDGLPQWPSIVVTTPDGKSEKRYKQEALFGIDDYELVIKYHHRRTRFHRGMAS